MEKALLDDIERVSSKFCFVFDASLLELTKRRNAYHESTSRHCELTHFLIYDGETVWRKFSSSGDTLDGPFGYEHKAELSTGKDTLTVRSWEYSGDDCPPGVVPEVMQTKELVLAFFEKKAQKQGQTLNEYMLQLKEKKKP